jgi:hypothetical protein
MNNIWQISIDDYLKIVEIAKTNGKKTGDSMEAEIVEYMRVNNRQPINRTELTKDEFIKELTSHNKNILDINFDKDKTEYKFHKGIDKEPI